MGRTLHWDIEKETNFTKKEFQAMIDVSIKYNSGLLKNTWTCENFWCNPYDYYPDWSNPILKDGNDKDGWKIVNKAWEQLEGDGMKYLDICLRLHKDGLIAFHDEKPDKRVNGFCKVQGNEYNSLLVYIALIEISIRIPKALIKISDEGEFLLCDIKLKKGKALPDIDGLRDDIKHWAAKISLENEEITKKFNLDGLNGQLLQDLGIGGSYGKELAIKVINNKLRNLKIIQNRIENKIDFAMYIYNIEHMPEDRWFDPMLFTRKVDIEKFKDYTMNPGTLMDGFKGEGFGLTDDDSESYSYKSIVNMLGMLGKMGYPKENIRVLGEKKSEMVIK